MSLFAAQRAPLPRPEDRKPCASVSFGAFRPEENEETQAEPIDFISPHFFLDKPNGRSYCFGVTSNPMSEAARILGSAKTPRKAKTSRENGKLGGRPKKKKKVKAA